MGIRSITFLASSIAIVVTLSSSAFAVGLTRTGSHTSATTSASIYGVGSDNDNDSGGLSSTCSSLVIDLDDPNLPIAESTAFMNSLATDAASTPVARVNGSTFTNSYLGAGYFDMAGNWHPGAVQSFTGSSETDSVVTSDGTLYHQIAFSLQTGAGTQEGYFHGWVRVGNVQVYFTWNGGNSIAVEEYIDGALDSSYDIVDNYGDFTYDTPFYQVVDVGDQIAVDAYGYFVDNDNLSHATRTVTLQGGTQ